MLPVHNDPEFWRKAEDTVPYIKILQPMEDFVEI